MRWFWQKRLLKEAPIKKPVEADISLRDRNCIDVPDLASIAFIPFFKSIDDVPENEYTKHNLADPAFHALFYTGNHPPPPDSFSGIDEFGDLVLSKNTRAAMHLRNLKLYYDDQQSPIAVSGLHLEEVGYTPIRMGINLRIIKRPSIVLGYSKGIGDGAYEIEFGDNCVIISQFVRFKIGKIGDLINKRLTRHWAPSAWMRTDYTICPNGSVSVIFAGTFIPSQTYYVSWRKVYSRDMLTNNTGQIDDFIEAGECIDALGRDNFLWPANDHK
jgi:hypothetical protein